MKNEIPTHPFSVRPPSNKTVFYRVDSARESLSVLAYSLNRREDLRDGDLAKSVCRCLHQLGIYLHNVLEPNTPVEDEKGAYMPPACWGKNSHNGDTET